MDRRRARREALCLIFEYSFNTEKTMQQIIESAALARDLEDDADGAGEFGYMVSLAVGATEHADELDELITPFLKGWKLSRLSRVSLAVLRLAMYELKYVSEVPDSVTVNEAVELAKAYDDGRNAAFVNGVLGAYIRSLGGQVGPDAADDAAVDADAGCLQDDEPDELQDKLPGGEG